jgi:hypothetical protein
MKRIKTIKDILDTYKREKSLESVKDYLLLKEELRIYDMDFLNALGVAIQYQELNKIVNRLINKSLKEIKNG